MNMDVKQWLEANATLVPSRIHGESFLLWVTKGRGDYITMNGLESDVEFLVELEVTDEVRSIGASGGPIQIGFNPKECKWYGWSHRAISGFGIGSTCKRGDCHYRPKNRDDFLTQMAEFWKDEHRQDVVGRHTESGVEVTWRYADAVPNEKIRGQITSVTNSYPDEYGKGEWTARTLADARQMAIDFARSVS